MKDNQIENYKKKIGICIVIGFFGMNCSYLYANIFFISAESWTKKKSIWCYIYDDEQSVL